MNEPEWFVFFSDDEGDSDPAMEFLTFEDARGEIIDELNCRARNFWNENDTFHIGSDYFDAISKVQSWRRDAPNDPHWVVTIESDDVSEFYTFSIEHEPY